MDTTDLRLFIARAWQRFPGCEPRGLAVKLDGKRLEREYDCRAENLWRARCGGGLVAFTGERRMRAALEECARAGKGRVALYAAGTHTRAMAGLLRDPPVEIAAIIDDDEKLQGRELWGVPDRESRAGPGDEAGCGRDQL